MEGQDKGDKGGPHAGADHDDHGALQREKPRTDESHHKGCGGGAALSKGGEKGSGDEGEPPVPEKGSQQSFPLFSENVPEGFGTVGEAVEKKTDSSQKEEGRRNGSAHGPGPPVEKDVPPFGVFLEDASRKGMDSRLSHI
jgi:hypothetical protein